MGRLLGDRYPVSELVTPSEAAVRVWQDAGPVLERLRRRELRTLTEEQALEAVLDLLGLTTILPPKVLTAASSDDEGVTFGDDVESR